MGNEWNVDRADQIAEILGQPVAGVAAKVADRLDPMSRDFIAHSPLVLVSTFDAAGRLDVSPKGDAPGFCHVAGQWQSPRDRPRDSGRASTRKRLRRERIREPVPCRPHRSRRTERPESDEVPWRSTFQPTYPMPSPRPFRVRIDGRPHLDGGGWPTVPLIRGRTAGSSATDGTLLRAGLVPRVLKGRPVPQPAALERMMAELGVAKKQTPKARWAFERSAEIARFYNEARDRLIAPIVRSAPPVPPQQVQADQRHGGGAGGGGGAAGQDPLIQGLVKRLPDPGSKWTNQDRKKWLTAAEHVFGLIYTEDSELESAS